MDRTPQPSERREPSRYRRSRPRLQRLVAVVATTSFVWSFLLAAPAMALTHPAPPDRTGIRLLTTEQMSHIVGSLGTIHAVSIATAPGSSYPWEGSVGTTNTGNGNKQTSIPIVGWTQKGGFPVALSLTHNSQSNRNAELGNKWTHSYDIYLMTSTGGPAFASQTGTAPNTGSAFTTGSNLVAHWGDDLAYQFANSGTDTFAAPTGIHDTLVKNVDGTFTITETSQTQYHFNASLYCDTITDPSGNVLSINRNAAGFVSNVTDATTRRITFGYNAANQITSITDPLSRVWTIGYNASSDLTSVSLPVLNGSTYSYTVSYDTTHDVTSVTTPGGRSTTFSYNSDGSLAWEQDGAGNRSTYTYASGLTTITDANGNAITHTYTSGLLTRVTDALGKYEVYGYDTANNKTSVQDKRGFTWAYTFDSSGNVLTKKDPYLNTTTLTYNAKNEPLTVSDPLSHLTTYTYDPSGVHALTVKDANNNTTTLAYNTDGTLYTSKDPLLHVTTYGYDADGNKNSVTDPLSHSTTAIYDGIGRPTSATDALSHTASTVYDVWDRVMSVTTPAGTTSETYDRDDNALTVTDPNSHTVTTTYDADSRPLTVMQTNGDVMTYTYDGNLPGGGFVTGQKGLLSARKNGNGAVTTFSYTARNQKASASYPDSTGETWSYNDAGAVAGHTDGKSQIISYGYDNRSLLTTVSYPAGSGAGTGVSYVYDNAGRQTGMTDVTGTTGYGYDNGNRLTSLQQPNGTTGYGYDVANRKSSMTISGVTGSWTYGYDNANRLLTTKNPNNETATNVYDNANRVTSLTNGNNSVTSYAYDNANRSTDVWHKTSTGTTLGRYQYSYDGASNVLTRTDNDGSVTTFGYDGSDQLTSEVRSITGGGSNPYTIAYTYDHNANRKTKVLGGVTDTYTYDNNDKLLSTSSKTYGYDLNGNCTSVKVGAATPTTLTYDIENRVTGISYPAGGTNSFVYNGEDLRTKKTDSAGTKTYKTDGSSPASAVLNDGGATYTPGLSERRGTTSSFYHSDALGSTRGITGSTQATTDSTLYDGFGMTVSETGTNPTPFGFVGKEQYQTDGDSGLQLLGHRYYDPSIGRFLSQDPAKSGTNWYKYADNNPLAKTDSSGLSVRDLQKKVEKLLKDLGYKRINPTGHPRYENAEGHKMEVPNEHSHAKENDWKRKIKELEGIKAAREAAEEAAAAPAGTSPASLQLDPEGLKKGAVIGTAIGVGVIVVMILLIPIGI